MSLPFKEEQSKKCISKVGLLEQLPYIHFHGKSNQGLKEMFCMDGITIIHMEIFQR